MCCLFTDSRQAFLLVASRNQIVQDDITAQPNVVRSLVRDGRNIVALDFDSVTDRVFWSDTSQDRIWSAHKNGSDRTVVSTACSFVINTDIFKCPFTYLLPTLFLLTDI